MSKKEIKEEVLNTESTQESEKKSIINVDLNSKNKDTKDKIVSFITNPIFISIAIILVCLLAVLLFVRNNDLPQAGAKLKAIGELNNPKVVVESFEDLECSGCQAYNPIQDNLITAYKDKSVQFVFKNFPLTSVHPNPEDAAEAAEYANDQGKFWEYKDLLYQKLGTETFSKDNLVKYGESLGLNGTEMRTKLDGRAYRTRVQNEQQEGFDKQVNSTPSIFINGTLVTTQDNTVPTQDQLSQQIDAELAK